MTITAALPSYVQLPGNGTALTFGAPMKCFQSSDVVVGFITGGVYIQQTSGFTIGNVDNNGGFTVTFAVAPPTLTTVDIRTITPMTQTTEFANLGSYLPENTTECFDRLTREMQDLYRRVYQFGIHGPDTDSVPWSSLPNAAGRANTNMGFDGSGMPAISQNLATGTLSRQSIGGLLYPQSTAERNAGVTPIDTSYPTTPYHHIRRYGFVGDGVTDDSNAWAQLALVMGQGTNGHVPPVPTMIKTTPTFAAPAFVRTHLMANGTTVLTTGPIYGITVTGGFLGGMTIEGITFENTTDSLCFGGINFFGCQNCYAVDCWAYQSSVIPPSAGYALVVMQNSDPTNDGTGAFWNKVIRCGTRQATGVPANYLRFGVFLSGSCNATEIEGCNFVAVNFAVGIYNSIAIGATGTLANAVYIHHNSFEGVVCGVIVNGQNVVASGASINGLRIESNRFEACSEAALLLTNLTADSAVPTSIFGSYFISSTAAYVAYNNGAVNITVNTNDPSITPSYPMGITFTAPLAAGATTALMTSVWSMPTGQWQIQFSDAETIQGNFINGSTAVSFVSGVVNAVSVNASVVIGAMTDQTSQGPFNFASVAGDAMQLTAASVNYGLTVGTPTAHNVHVRNRSGGGGYIDMPQNGDYRVLGTRVVGPQVAGYGTPTGNVKTASFPGASATLVQTAQQLAQLLIDLKTHGLIGT